MKILLKKLNAVFFLTSLSFSIAGFPLKSNAETLTTQPSTLPNVNNLSSRIELSGAAKAKLQNFIIGNWSVTYLIDSVDNISIFEEITYNFDSKGNFLAKNLTFHKVGNKKTILEDSVRNITGKYSMDKAVGDKVNITLTSNGKTVSDTVKLPEDILKLPSNSEALKSPINSKAISIGDFRLNPVPSF